MELADEGGSDGGGFDEGVSDGGGSPAEAADSHPEGGWSDGGGTHPDGRESLSAPADASLTSDLGQAPEHYLAPID